LLFIRTLGLLAPEEHTWAGTVHVSFFLLVPRFSTDAHAAVEETRVGKMYGGTGYGR
jgi:hypothetical protein